MSHPADDTLDAQLSDISGQLAELEKTDAGRVRLAFLQADLAKVFGALEQDSTAPAALNLLKSWEGGDEPLRKGIGGAFLARARAILAGTGRALLAPATVGAKVGRQAGRAIGEGLGASPLLRAGRRRAGWAEQLRAKQSQLDRGLGDRLTGHERSNGEYRYVRNAGRNGAVIGGGIGGAAGVGAAAAGIAAGASAAGIGSGTLSEAQHQERINAAKAPRHRGGSA